MALLFLARMERECSFPAKNTGVVCAFLPSCPRFIEKMKGSILHSCEREEVEVLEKHLAFRFERETKRTYRFQEESEDPIVGTLYVQKSAFKSRPEKIDVHLKAED